jgi:hypothetical protein
VLDHHSIITSTVIGRGTRRFKVTGSCPGLAARLARRIAGDVVDSADDISPVGHVNYTLQGGVIVMYGNNAQG